MNMIKNESLSINVTTKSCSDYMFGLPTESLFGDRDL